MQKLISTHFSNDDCGNEQRTAAPLTHTLTQSADLSLVKPTTEARVPGLAL